MQIVLSKQEKFEKSRFLFFSLGYGHNDGVRHTNGNQRTRGKREHTADGFAFAARKLW